jgi:tocopherol O-methyltransferase
MLVSMSRRAKEASEEDPDVVTSQVRDHYDRLSSLYQTFWGDHIHHGVWEEGSGIGPAAAQEALVAELARSATIPLGARVLDVGCGLGGSALWLAEQLECRVTGITLSPVQRDMAAARAAARGRHDRVRFLVQDANNLDPLSEAFDAVWCIECSEHLHDKRRFVVTAFSALKPGGRLALCAWLAGDDPTRPDYERVLGGVRRGMLCPSLGTMSDYLGWMRDAGFTDVSARDLTRRVEKTWDLSLELLGRLRISDIRDLLHQDSQKFLEAFGLMRRAYSEGIMAYGLFTARKPSL